MVGLLAVLVAVGGQASGPLQAQQLDKADLRARGEAEAQYNLCIEYSLARDFTQAVLWCRKAAEQGLANAQNNLGIAYAYGEGVARDYVEAHKWLNLAASRASKAALQAFVLTRDEIEKKMTREQVLGAQRLAQEWAEALERRLKK